MEDIEIDFKLIIVVICISAIIGAILWVGYNIYIESTTDENEGVENFEGNISSNINSSTNINNNRTEFNISEIISDDGFEINNKNAININEDWVERITYYHGGNYRVSYHVPNDWKSQAGRDTKNGVEIRTGMLELKNLTKETTYEQFLNNFIETKEKKEFSPEEVKNYSKRTIDINGEKLYVLVKEEYYNAIYEYFCLVKENFVYYLETHHSKDNYNQEVIKSIDEIYATFRIY